MARFQTRNLLFFVVFFLLIISQPAQILSQTTISKVDESSITSASYVSDINAAHITAPTTLANHDDHKSYTILPALQRTMQQLASHIPKVDGLFQRAIDLKSFINAVMYQSNYLPC
ncbi:hypothetical protein CFK37_09605 [Virgibacillus phasianinus]|uniref:Uncharacterized protein n=1 Tax=Virgibacillus phasianinus TaxID=2017483 RepID=A0A220U3U0_9BACI|nr:hypothetical protein [Virgibacillus phasianinus]ASK62393.1 hypothetical protein CFK37_09605 [Virgibacillus phasianinus]